MDNFLCETVVSSDNCHAKIEIYDYFPTFKDFGYIFIINSNEVN